MSPHPKLMLKARKGSFVTTPLREWADSREASCAWGPAQPGCHHAALQSAAPRCITVIQCGVPLHPASPPCRPAAHYAFQLMVFPIRTTVGSGLKSAQGQGRVML